MKVYVYTRAIMTIQEGWVSIDETQVFTNPEDALATFNRVKEIWMNDEDDAWVEDWNTCGLGDMDNYSAHYSCNNDEGDIMTQSVNAHEI